MKRLFLTALFSLCISLCQGIGIQDSLLIVNAKWYSEYYISSGIKVNSAQIEGLFGSTQSIHLVEIPRSRRLIAGIAGNKGMLKTSHQAKQNNALVAINGSFYDMKRGNSVCFYKVDKEVIDSTHSSELHSRVNGAVRVRNGKIQILPWSKEIELNYRGRQGSVLASGPMLVEDGKECDWSAFEQGFIDNRHPRSVIFTSQGGKTVMLVVDGRSKGNAEGMSIRELAFLVKILGAKDALNLDGGGSSTLWTSSEGIINHPSDNRRFDHEGERSVSNIIYIKQRE